MIKSLRVALQSACEMLLTSAVFFSVLACGPRRQIHNVMSRFTHSPGSPSEVSLAPSAPCAAIGLPARIVCAEGLTAQAVTRHGACALGLALTGPLAEGAWVLAANGAAHAVIDAGRAREIDAALDLLDAIARGDLDETYACSGLARYFAVVNRHADIAHSR
jgi:hypothetical protein